jgi:uncharacterized protein YbjQ (UPF0145 family)
MSGDDDISIPEEISELPLSESDLPPEEMPALDGEPEFEQREFLTAEREEPVAEEPPAEGLPADETTAASDVDDMLSAELLPEGFDSLPDLGSALPQLPTFQLHLRGLTDSTRAALKKTLDAQGAAVPEQAWAAGAPVISQLSEYQLIVLLQAARALGIAAEAFVSVPEQGPSEDDLALGDLSLVPDPAFSQSESAPSVTLPKGEKEVMVFTPDQVPGATVRESFGLVMAHRSIARRIFREEEVRDKLQKELRSVPGRIAATLPSSHLQIVLRELMLDLRKAALAKGANAVLGVKLESFPESGMGDPQLEQLRLVAFGTAAVVDKS